MHVSYIHIILPRFWRIASSTFLFSRYFVSPIILGRSTSCQGWLLAYLVQGRFPVSWSWWMVDIYCCRLTQDTSPDPSSSWWNFPRLSYQDWIYNLLGSCTAPWSWSQIQVSDLGYWSKSSYLGTSLSCVISPCVHQLSSPTRFLQGNGVV